MSEYYWCLTHGRVEQGRTCPSTQRLGPYGSAQGARDFRERAEARDEAWRAEDQRWDPDLDDD